MWLERLPWLIPIKSPPFVEPDKPVTVEFGRQVIFRAMEHVGSESRIIQQHSLVVANILYDDVGHRGHVVAYETTESLRASAADRLRLGDSLRIKLRPICATTRVLSS